jgi:outer membrane protein TolC
MTTVACAGAEITKAEEKCMRVRVAAIAAMLSVVTAAGAIAQDGAATQVVAPGITRLTPPPASNRPLSLAEAVIQGLEHNPSIAVERLQVDEARQHIRGERGIFDPLLTVTGNAGRRDNVVASRFYPTGLYADRQDGSRVALESKTDVGGRLNLGVDFQRLASTSNTQTLSPQYTGNFIVGFTQPLLRDFGHAATTAHIRVAAKQTEIAEQTLSRRVGEFVARIDEAYWTLVYGRQQLLEKQRILDTQRGYLQQAELLLAADRATLTSVTQAKVTVAERETDVVAAEAEVGRDEDALKSLVDLNLAVGVVPSETFDRRMTIPDPEKSVETALRRRPEILALQRELEQREIEQRLAANQKLPRLDLTAQYVSTNLSGKPSTSCVDPTVELCVPVGSTVPDSVFSGRTAPGDALTGLILRHPFDGWSAELHMEVPLGNRAAKAAYSEASVRVEETRARLDAARSQIEQEIRGAVRDAQAAQKRAAVAHTAVTAVAAQAHDVSQQFEARLVSSYDVQHANDELDKANSVELKALMDFNIALGRLQLADTTILDRFNIEVATASRNADDVR